jgi:hypothetical protein
MCCTGWRGCADRSRIEKLVNMLASPFDGEANNAFAALRRMAAKRNITVPDALSQGLATPKPPASHPQWSDTGDLLDQLAQAAKYKSVLSKWDRGFAANVLRHHARPDSLTDRQKIQAERIVAKARRAALAGETPD